MDFVSNGCALLLCACASTAFYLGCPNQQWLPQRKFNFYQGLLLSIVLATAAVVFFAGQMSLLSSIFAVVTCVMLLLGVLPFFSHQPTPAVTQRKAAGGLIKSKNAKLYRAHWLLRPILAFVLGFPLAVGLSGLIVMLSPGPLSEDVKSQFAMWLVTPLWLVPFSLVFFSHRLWPWWAGLGSLNGLVFGLLWYLQISPGAN